MEQETRRHHSREPCTPPCTMHHHPPAVVATHRRQALRAPSLPLLPNPPINPPTRVRTAAPPRTHTLARNTHARNNHARKPAHTPPRAHTQHTHVTLQTRAHTHTHTTLHSHATLHTLHSTFPFRGVVVIFINPTFAAISALVVVAGPEVLLCAHEPRGVSLAECRFVQFQCAGVVVADPACCVGVGGWLVVDKASAQLLTVAQVLRVLARSSIAIRYSSTRVLLAS